MVNKVVLVGRFLGKDPEVRHLSDTSSVCNFTLATNESYKDRQGNRVDQTSGIILPFGDQDLLGLPRSIYKKGSSFTLKGSSRPGLGMIKRATSATQPKSTLTNYRCLSDHKIRRALWLHKVMLLCLAVPLKEVHQG